MGPSVSVTPSLEDVRRRPSMPESKLRLHELPSKQFWAIVIISTTLSFNGGVINGIALAGVFQIPLTHVTGVITFAAVRMVQPDGTRYDALFYWGHLLMYTLGAMLGGLVLGKVRRRWRGRQTCVLALEAIALWWAVLLCYSGHLVKAAFAIAIASGLQNSITSNMSIAAIRTMNHTGTIVDIGSAIGLMRVDGWSAHSWRLKIWVPLFLGFWGGSVIGALGFMAIGRDVMFAPAISVTLLTILSGAWTATHKRHERKVLAGVTPAPSPFIDV